MVNSKSNKDRAPAFLPPEVLNELAELVISKLKAQNGGTCLLSS